MKRLSLKATSLILALVLALSLSVTAFADDNAASRINVVKNLHTDLNSKLLGGNIEIDFNIIFEEINVFYSVATNQFNSYEIF